jgi:hypothetical protein
MSVTRKAHPQARAARRIAPSSLGAGLLWAAMSSFSFADTLHDIGGGTYQHHDSGWTFLHRIGDFTRVGAAQDVEGTVDVVAHYARTTQSGRTTAIIDVYPEDSAAAQAQFAEALSALRNQSPDGASQVQQAIHIEHPMHLVPVKTFYETASSNDTKPAVSAAHSVLYFIDTGHWIVKIRTHMERRDAASLAASDAFVLSQPWETLGLTKETCTGPACAAVVTSAPQPHAEP